jgi:hypothetical protein
MQYGYPSLTPTTGLGTRGRTGAALVISNRRTKLASQGRVYAFYKQRGEGQLYEQQLINALGLKNLPKVNIWSLM